MVKIAYVTKSLSLTGIANVIMNYSKHLRLLNYDVTIITGLPIENMYVKLCKEYGIKIVELPRKVEFPIRYYRGLWKELANNYDIVHVHGNSAVITVELLLAFLRGKKIRIAHSHCSNCKHIKIHNLLYPLFRKMYTYGLACSVEAGKWMFRDDQYTVLPNAFEVTKFKYNENNRNKVRMQLGLQDKFVIGNVAGFYEVKNHPYLLEVFNIIAKENENAYLLLVGKGNSQNVMDLIENHPFRDRIICYGATESVEDIYNAIDVFVLPSKYEGLGIVFIEAQINGVPVVTSDRVPNEVNICNGVKFLPLEENKNNWASQIMNVNQLDRNKVYQIYEKEIAAYDIKKCAETLSELYGLLLK